MKKAPKTLLKRRLFIAAIVGLAFSLAIASLFILKDFSEDGLAPFLTGQVIKNMIVAVPKQEEARSGLPIRIKIPKIGVDASIEYVGVALGGVMDVPKERANVAWFNLGPRPGEKGSAVMAGHYGWRNGKVSVFDNLYKLRKGDKLYVEDEKGAIITFVVRESRRYDPKADASAVFGSGDGKAHLNLVTCEGIWDKIFKSYSRRLVVFTDRAIEQ